MCSGISGVCLLSRFYTPLTLLLIFSSRTCDTLLASNEWNRYHKKSTVSQTLGMHSKKQPKNQKQIALPLLIGAALLMATMIILSNTTNSKQDMRSRAAGISAQLCGTNLGLFNSNDSFLTSP